MGPNPDGAGGGGGAMAAGAGPPPAQRTGGVPRWRRQYRGRDPLPAATFALGTSRHRLGD